MRRTLYSILLLAIMFLAAPYLIIRITAPEAAREAVGLITLVEPVERSQAPDSAHIRPPPIELDDFERYLIGVVAAEMPALFHIEALRAQAVASRTYALYAMGVLGMEVFDHSRISEIWQAYISEDEMRRRWGDGFYTHFATVSEAVSSTAGEILVYNGEPIVAVFHAWSGGMTEYSANVWSEQRPYLISVNSDFYSHRTDFEQVLEFSGNEFISLLRQEFHDIVFEGGDIISQIIIDSRSRAGYVTDVTVGNKKMDGALLRRVLGLRSTNFTVSRELDKIIFRTKGYGHGAGMSQVGANALAQQGYDYVRILLHYYTGVQLVRTDALFY